MLNPLPRGHFYTAGNASVITEQGCGRPNSSMPYCVTNTGSDAVLVIDAQNDFCPGGHLPVPHGDEVVAPINKLARRFEDVVLTQDWHPPRHSSFASSHSGRRPYESVEASY